VLGGLVEIPMGQFYGGRSVSNVGLAGVAVAPTGDRLFPLEFQRRVAHERLGLGVEKIAAGHLPMLSGRPSSPIA
jgi:hypothetical protein